jgi:hypothetical protein
MDGLMLGMNSFLWICQCLSRVLRPILGEPAVLPLFLPNVSPLYIFVPGLLAALPDTWRYKLGPAKDGYVASQSLLQCLRGKLEPESFVCEPGAPIRRGAHGGGVLSPPARWGSRFYEALRAADLRHCWTSTERPLRSGARGWCPAAPISQRMSEYMPDKMPNKMSE